MSPKLAEQLYSQLKQVFKVNIAIVDPRVVVVEQCTDFPKIKHFVLAEPISREKIALGIDDNDSITAMPIYVDEKLVGLVVAETPREDIQNIQVISSMAELIAQQFIYTHRPRPDTVDLLITRLVYRPETFEEDELEQQMAALGYRLDVKRTVVIFELRGFWDNYLQVAGDPLGEKSSLIESKKADINQVLKSFFTKNPDNLIGYIGSDRFAVIKDLSTTDYDHFCKLLTTNFSQITNTLKNVYISEVTIGIGSPANSSAEIIASAKEASQVIDIGKNLNVKNRVHRIGALGALPLLVSSSPKQKLDYAQKVLSELVDEELIETLEQFLEDNLNLTKTAENLKIHRNTVIYRLDKIQEKIGRDPRDFADAVELYLALMFKKVFS